MPRKATLKGLQSITRHNIIKFLDKQKLTKKEYNEVIKLAEEYLNNASHEDLKQKGIVQKIINGGMKRPNEGDDNEEGKQKRRNILRRVIGIPFGEPFNEDEYKIQTFRESIQDLTNEEKRKLIAYEKANAIAEEAIKVRDKAKTEYENIKLKKNLELDSSKTFLKSNDSVKRIEQYHKQLLVDLLKAENQAAQGYTHSSSQQDTLDKILINDIIYFNATGKHFNDIDEKVGQQQLNQPSSSSASSSSSVASSAPPNQLAQPNPPPQLAQPAPPQEERQEQEPRQETVEQRRQRRLRLEERMRQLRQQPP